MTGHHDEQELVKVLVAGLAARPRFVDLLNRGARAMDGHALRDGWGR